MNSKRILVVGRGHLGSFLAERWGTPETLHWRQEMERLDANQLRALAPDAVINCAGKTDLAWCEANPLETFRCNVTAPVGLLRALRASGSRAPFIHISSGCLWDGPYHPEGRGFRPTDPVRPACYYAWTKAACDALLLQEQTGALHLLRPRQLFSPLPSPRNTLMKLNGYPKLLDTPNSMTSCDTVARTIEVLLAAPEGSAPQVLNVYDRGVTSPYEIGMLLAEAGLREAPARLEKSALDAWHKPKRVDTVLEDAAFERLVNPPHVLEQARKSIAMLPMPAGAAGAD